MQDLAGPRVDPAAAGLPARGVEPFHDLDRHAAQGQFGNLIFGFAVTEALGIFSLLIALLLLFAL